MARLEAEFLLSAAANTQFPGDGLPEVALVGRSNVGKSTLINTLVGVRGLARTSNTPGRTQTLNYYRATLHDAGRALPFYLVDMPGYGYAKVPPRVQAQWRKLIDGYLYDRRTLRAVVQIVDLRHPPSEDDRLMWEWLRYHDRQRLLVATKADKVARSKHAAQRRVIESGLGLNAGTEPLLLFSAVTRAGRDEVLAWLAEQVVEHPDRT